MISIVLPTRNRHDKLAAMFESAWETAANKKMIEFCIYIDTDDTASKQYLDLMIAEDLPVKYVSSDGLNLSEMWNYAYKHLATGDIIMLCADDIRFRTPGWDTFVKAEFDKSNDKLIMVYGDDGNQGERLATHPFVHRKWIEVSGFWLPPYFVSDFVDLWIHDVARRISRAVYLPSVVTEHLHFTIGKAEIDDTTQRRLDRHAAHNPLELYFAKEHERVEHASKLLANIV